MEAYIWSWMSFKLLGKLNCHTQKLKEVNQLKENNEPSHFHVEQGIT